jgi:methionyl-tRNA synthetase
VRIDRRVRRRYLLIGSPPTPNGRAHLGHIAGPFLRLDVLARHLSVLGDEAVLVSGSDSYDMYVLLTARKEGKPPDEIAARCHAAMEADLRAMDIGLAAFIDPMSAPWASVYEELLTETIARLIRAGATEARRERVLYSPTTGRHIIACWLLGGCPTCGADAGGYFCEACGAFFRPELIRNPHPRFDEGPLEWRRAEPLYLRSSAPSRLVDTWDVMGIGAAFQAAGRRFLAEHGATFPLTQPGSWGIPWKSGQGPSDQVLFSYGALHQYLRLFGAAYGSITGRHVNAFDADSGVTSVLAFGIDNVIPYLVPTIGIALEDPASKPCDHYLINYFYELEGAKFSTSRGHVIWGLDMARTPAGSDAARCYLAKVNPEHAPASFNVDDFVGFVNAFLVGRLDPLIQRRWQQQALRLPPTAAPASLVGRLGSLMEEREAVLDPRHFNLAGSVDQLETWLTMEPDAGEGASAAYWWLKGLSLLAYPLMPKLGSALWSALGQPGTPSMAEFGATTEPTAHIEIPRFTSLAAADLAPCLPETLIRDPLPSRRS